MWSYLFILFVALSNLFLWWEFTTLTTLLCSNTWFYHHQNWIYILFRLFGSYSKQNMQSPFSVSALVFGFFFAGISQSYELKEHFSLPSVFLLNFLGYPDNIYILTPRLGPLCLEKNPPSVTGFTARELRVSCKNKHKRDRNFLTLIVMISPEGLVPELS